jgi:hypothetical protein
VRCDRCPQYYLVKPLAEADQCIYHWGRPYTTRIGGNSLHLELNLLLTFCANRGKSSRVFLLFTASREWRRLFTWTPRFYRIGFGDAARPSCFLIPTSNRSYRSTEA